MNFNDYETIWDAGEVEWEFKTKDTYFAGLLEYNNHIDSFLYDSVSTSYPSSDKNTNIIDINENKLINNILLNAILSGIWKALYNEFIRVDSLILEMNELIYDNYSGNNLNNDILLLLLSLLLSIHYYSKNKTIPYNNIDDMKEYLKIRRTSTILFFILFTIITKNVQHVN
jgi:hypothetical protein